jgi:hypothetical protein
MELSDELLDKCGSLLYRAWAEAWDALKRVKDEKPDGHEDWQQFHDHRLATAQAEEAKLKAMLEELKPHLPLVKAVREGKI